MGNIALARQRLIHYGPSTVGKIGVPNQRITLSRVEGVYLQSPLLRTFMQMSKKLIMNFVTVALRVPVFPVSPEDKVGKTVTFRVID
jgi:hypothetical protein